MREIKFRAYDTYTKTMLPVVDIIKFTKSEDIYITRDGAYGVVINMQYQPHIELMQYIGLKDKNGTEIYEGDIVRIETSNIDMVGTIIYDEYDLAFELRDNEEGVQECLWYQEQELEVLGNIYDNPDLLKGESNR